MLLSVRGLEVEYFGKKGNVPAVRGVSFDLDSSRSLGIVGESGSGKTTLALALAGLVGSHEGRARGEGVVFEGRDLLLCGGEELRRLRGKDIGFVFQDPFSSLNPVMTIGAQIEEAILVHARAGRSGAADRRTRDQARARGLELLSRAQIPDPPRVHGSYPHQISGGQRQRAMIAMAVANRPKLLIADEPTTALDVTVQKDILELLTRLRKELDMALLFITHHLGIASLYTEDLLIMYAGKIVESGPTAEVLSRPQHPYTRALLDSVPGRPARGAARRRRLAAIAGSPPDPTHLPAGCAFHPRCPFAEEICRTDIPEARDLEGMERRAACHLAPLEGP
ncbi:MAG: hypothetical protein A2902_07165 [Elusimicrobia bacterium RIFCSPLOWO2_01_FULL_64_13]|nr:MAG: hypothetical protein A2902_07165 [Elusimicrobia bacterium RIFCSPLOWO2_01_FULL_64_13]